MAHILTRLRAHVVEVYDPETGKIVPRMVTPSIVQRDGAGKITCITLHRTTSISKGNRVVLQAKHPRGSDQAQLGAEAPIELDPEMNILLGTNGSGKSTVLRALSKLVEPSPADGTAEWEDNERETTFQAIATLINPVDLIPEESLIIEAQDIKIRRGNGNVDTNRRLMIEGFRLPWGVTHHLRREDLWGWSGQAGLQRAAQEDPEMLNRISSDLQEVIYGPISSVQQGLRVSLEQIHFMEQEEYQATLVYGIWVQESDRHESTQEATFISYSLMSHGMRRLLGLLTLIELDNHRWRDHEAKPVLLFDEPGEGLHPLARKRLFEKLQRLSADRQIIIATHEVEMIPEERVGRTSNGSGATEDTKIRIIKRNEDLSISIRKPDWGTDGIELSPVMKAKKLDLIDNILRDKIALLVEGSSDEDFIRTVLESRAYQGPQLRRRLQMVAVKGTNGMLDMAKMLTARSRDEVSHHDFIVMMDTDADPGARKAINNLISPDQPVMIGSYGRLNTVCSCHDLAQMPDQEHAEQLRQHRHDEPNSKVRCKLGEIEDLLEPDEYLSLFNQALGLTQPLTAPSDLQIPITKWIEGQLKDHPEAGDAPGCKVHRKKGSPGKWEFHGEVGRWFSENPTSVQLSQATLERFGQLIAALNDRALLIEKNVSTNPMSHHAGHVSHD